MRRLLHMLSALVLVGCSALGPPPEGARELLAVRDEAAGERRVGYVDIESEAFTGSFKSVLVSESGGPRVRLQLLPELGTKVLDLAAGPDGLQSVWAFGAGDGTARLERMVAISLLEGAAGLDFARVVAGAERAAGGFVLEVAPVVPGVEVRVEVAADGRVVGRRFADGVVRWAERFEPEHAFVAPGFSWRVLDEERTPLEAVPAGLFEVRGADVRPW